MKLINQQIDALLAVMEKKHNQKQKAVNEKKIQEASKKVSGRAKELMKIYEKLPQELKSLYGSYSKPSEKVLTERLRGNIPINKFDRSDMRNEILIASIDSATMDELKKKMKIEI